MLLENTLKEILWAGLEAVHPEETVRRSLILEGDCITTAGGDSFEARRAFVLSAGKAAGRMAHAAQQVLGGKLAGGLVITKDDHSAGPAGMETLYASHPEPDERGMEATPAKRGSLWSTLERETFFWPSSAAAPRPF